MTKDYFPSILAFFWILKFVAALNPSCAGKDVFIPFINEDDSASYFVCINQASNAIQVECPQELVFNAETRSCSMPVYVAEKRSKLCRVENQLVDHPENTENSCTKNQKCNAELKMEPDNACTTQGHIFSPLLGECIEADCSSNKEKRPDCSKDIYKLKKMIVFDDDAAYYICENQIRIKKKCPSNNFFDPLKKDCSPRTGSIHKPPKLPDIKSICNGNARKFIPDPLYCKGYYYCIDDDTPYWNYCDEIPYVYFNNGQCVSSRPNTCICEDLNYSSGSTKVYAKHTSKNKYYICEKNKVPIPMSCPSGYIFDANDESCIQV